MTTVPVLWVTHDPGGMVRHYADMGLWEAILDRTLWTPADPIRFEHHEVRGGDFPQVAGALVVLPARHNAAPEATAWFVSQLERLAWSVVLLAGDEGVEFDWRSVPETDGRRVWIMQPRAEHEGLSGLIPGGWYPGTREGVAHEAAQRPKALDWFFGGQVTHERRQEAAQALQGVPRGLLHATDRYFDLRDMPQDVYFGHLASAKVVPCPSGPLTVDTARAFEAMEAGCQPILDIVSPGQEPWDYWAFLLGADFPAPRIVDWAALPEAIEREVSEWPGNANRTWGEWQRWKRRTVLQLDADLRAVSGAARCMDEPDSKLTVIVTTSPIPSHPETGIIRETISSIRAQLPTADIVIAIDGLRPEQAYRKTAYDEYVRRLLWLMNFEWTNVVPVVLPEWGHQANATRAALEEVRTPLVLFVEHDTPIVGEIDWAGVCAVVESGQMNVVRFHHEAEIHEDHRAVMLDEEPVTLHVPFPDGGDAAVDVYRSVAFWQRPHVATTSFYRDRIMPIFPESSRTMIEDRVYGLVAIDWVDRGEDGWRDWLIGIYAPNDPDGNIKRSTHLDGRDTDPKYEMWFE